MPSLTRHLLRSSFPLAISFNSHHARWLANHRPPSQRSDVFCREEEDAAGSNRVSLKSHSRNGSRSRLLHREERMALLHDNRNWVLKPLLCTNILYSIQAALSGYYENCEFKDYARKNSIGFPPFEELYTRSYMNFMRKEKQRVDGEDINKSDYQERLEHCGYALRYAEEQYFMELTDKGYILNHQGFDYAQSRLEMQRLLRGDVMQYRNDLSQFFSVCCQTKLVSSWTQKYLRVLTRVLYGNSCPLSAKKQGKFLSMLDHLSDPNNRPKSVSQFPLLFRLQIVFLNTTTFEDAKLIDSFFEDYLRRCRTHRVTEMEVFKTQGQKELLVVEDRVGPQN